MVPRPLPVTTKLRAMTTFRHRFERLLREWLRR